MRVADQADGGGELGVFERGVSRVRGFGWLGAVDIAAEDIESEFGKAVHQAGAAGKEDSRANGLDGSGGQAGADEFECFLEALADDFIEDGAFDFNVGEAVFIGELGDADGEGGIGGGVALKDFEFLRFGKRQPGDEVDIVGDVVSADGDAAGGGDGAFQIEGVIGGAAADVDQQCAAEALLAVECHLRGGDGGEDDVINFQGALADELDGVLNAVADAMNDVEIGFNGFREESDR